MKNKILFLGSLCLILAFGLVVIGCTETVDPRVPEVAVKVERVVGPTIAAKDSKSPVFIVSWKAVEGAVKYIVYTQTQDADSSVFNVRELAVVTSGDSNTLTPISGFKYIPTAYPAAITATATTDADDVVTAITPAAGAAEAATASDWAAVVDFSDVIGAAITDLGLGRVGVMAIPLRTEKDPSIVWMPYEEFDITLTPEAP